MINYPTYYVVFRTCVSSKSYYGYDCNRGNYHFGFSKANAHTYSTRSGAMTAARNFARAERNKGWVSPLWFTYDVEEWRYDIDGKED